MSTLRTTRTGHFIGALDIGGTKMLLGLINWHGELVARRRLETRAEQGVEHVITRAATGLRELLGEVGATATALDALGCSVPGPLDNRTGVVLFSPNLGWRNVPLLELLRREFAVPIAIDDDAHCAALGEGRKGAARGSRCAVYVTISTGIGAGVIINGNLYRGAHGFAGEVGHIPLEANGPRCACGNTGCFEALASGSAIAAQARQAVLQGSPTIMATFHDDLTRLTAVEVMEAAAAGDAVAGQILERVGEYVGMGLAAVACAFDPEIIVVGGGVIQANETLLARARVAFARHVVPPLGSLTPIVPAMLGDESSLWGAAMLVSPFFDEEVSSV